MTSRSKRIPSSTAQLNNQSAAAGGLGAGGGELAARYITGQLFPGKTAQQLNESEKQQVSALSQLAAGLAGGLATGDTAGAVTGGQAGKNAVENNSLSDIIENKVSGVSRLNYWLILYRKRLFSIRCKHWYSEFSVSAVI
ncbi:Possible hemagglutinin (DUF638) [Serratia entomophila]|nr:Possible hemagglutinin (DUF638) [Serratia entomophila]CAI1527100.1 Possible hemagglutinin (DUF638) [Serratia entomophila]CAI1576951.1 Possible hemagglutinin (DUF638) [Serratia entomophila]CAI1583086.1 Possible hemagglutinin (DUF638) [Serratia entomophila]CAI1608531.1 Possible hemagglutinin (DUF638) [Serratia entomophila]